MGEAKRRREAALRCRLPDGVRPDIANIVRNVHFRGHAGGICLYRALSGLWLFKMLGVPCELVLGGMVYRTGPDPQRDVVAFCGPGNIGQYVPGHGILGHFWLRSGDDIIDFSAGDWRSDMTDELRLPAGVMLVNGSLSANDDLGEIQWEAPPPDYFWLPYRDVAMRKGGLTPDIGKAYYTGWAGPLPFDDHEFQHDFRDDCWNPVKAYFAVCIDQYDLTARIR